MSAPGNRFGPKVSRGAWAARCCPTSARLFGWLVRFSARCTKLFSRRASLSNFAREPFFLGRKVPRLARKAFSPQRSSKTLCMQGKKVCKQRKKACERSPPSLRASLFSLRARLRTLGAKLFALRAEFRTRRTTVARRAAPFARHQQGETGMWGQPAGRLEGAEKRSGEVGARSALQSSDWPQLFECSGAAA